MKKAQYYAVAERMYVVEQYTFDGIAAQLNLSDKTVRNWAAEGKWHEKRAALLKSRTALHEDLYSFARKLVRIISIDMDRLTETDGSDADRDGRIESRINSLSRLLDKLPKARGYETDVSAARAAEEQAKENASPDAIEERVKGILGL